jgi:TRAP-type C4-dicarboxylate transport system substrate-binding protein
VKRIFLILLSVLMVGAIIFGGCTSQQTSTPSGTTGEEPSTEVKPVEWTFVTFIPPFDVYAMQAQDWANKLEEATGGRLKITFYWAESLVKEAGLLDAVTSGTADVGHNTLAPFPERLSLAWIGTLPGIFESTPQAAKSIMAVFNKYPEIGEQYAPAKVIWLQVPGPSEITSTKPIKTIDDMKGLKISSGYKYEMMALQALGAVPVPVYVTEVYQALETNVVEASCLDFNAFYLWKLYEVTKYRTGNTIGTMLFFSTIMNSNSYEKLPVDVRQAFDEVTAPMNDTANAAFAAFAANSIEEIKKYDKQVGNPGFYYLPADEHQRWVDKIWPVNEEWVKENADKGFSAQAMLDDLVAFANQYK